MWHRAHRVISKKIVAPWEVTSARSSLKPTLPIVKSDKREQELPSYGCGLPGSTQAQQQAYCSLHHKPTHCLDECKGTPKGLRYPSFIRFGRRLDYQDNKSPARQTPHCLSLGALTTMAASRPRLSTDVACITLPPISTGLLKVQEMLVNLVDVHRSVMLSTSASSPPVQPRYEFSRQEPLLRRSHTQGLQYPRASATGCSTRVQESWYNPALREPRGQPQFPGVKKSLSYLDG